MKKITLLSLLSLLIISAWGQSSVQRNKVVLEVVTGTWCVFCPGWALAADDFHNNGDEVAVIEYHGGDAYETSTSSARINYYNATSYPTAVFNGTDVSTGGHASNSLYNQAYGRYTAAYGTASPIDMDMQWSYDTITQTFTVNAILEQVNTIAAGTNPVLHFAITESHIPASWFGLTDINFVERTMLPNANGTVLALQLGVKDTISYSFTLDAAWDRQNVEIVSFIQDPASRTIFNGAVESLHGPTSTYDAAILAFDTEIGSRLCKDDPLAPDVEIENNGATVLTSLDINYTVNNEGVQTYNWTGSLAYGETEIVSIPAITFTQLVTANELKVFVSNPNGSQDQESTNDLIAATFDYPTHNPGTYQLVITPDVKGSEITWEMINDKDGAIVAAGGPYFDGSTSLIVKQFSVGDNTGCYTFRMMDAGGDGMLVFSAGTYQLRDGKGNIVAISTDGDYGSLDQSQFTLEFATAVEPLVANLVKVFPNPTSSIFTVEMPELRSQAVSLDLFQLNGTLVAKANTQNGQHQFDLSDQPAGIYMLKVQTVNGVFVQKITKQ